MLDPERTKFKVSVDGQPQASTLTLEDALRALPLLPRGLATIEFPLGDEVIRLSRYTYLIDNGFNVVVV